MPKVFDNVALRLVDSLKAVLTEAHAADFCVGYFHLRGWSSIENEIKSLSGGSGNQARILVGMTATDESELKDALSIADKDEFGRAEARKRHTELMQGFRQQLTFGLPSDTAEASIRTLLHHLEESRVALKLFVRYPLHAKLYLLHRHVAESELFAFLGSSNLTAPGLYKQGELNIDVQDQVACKTLSKWFEDRWNDPFAVDATIELQEVIKESWAAEELFNPYHVYLKIAYHLAFDAIEASLEYKLPPLFQDIVVDFQQDAILRCRRYLNRRPLAILADVVGMGKTLAASAVAKLFQDEEGGRCIICCPVKLEPMWKEYIRDYEIAGEVVPYSQSDKLAGLTGRCRLMVLDESHNLRNRETVAWSRIKDYIRDQEAKVLLLSATPYNKHYEDLASQLRLALDEKADLGCRPEDYFRTHAEQEFVSKHQAPPTSLAAFEQSDSSDDWADLLRHFLVRRTRDFIISNYGEYDEARGRHFLTLKDGTRSYFPKRVPITLAFPLDANKPNDQYARLLTAEVEGTIGHLTLPRYGLGGYVDATAKGGAGEKDKELLENLSSAGQRLIGYCKTNLFKRLESSGHSFLLSLQRHSLRNLVFIYAIDNGLDLPIGTQDSAILDTATSDSDADSDVQALAFDPETEENQDEVDPVAKSAMSELMAQAKAVYESYEKGRKARRRQFRWISSKYFNADLRKHLLSDAQALLEIVEESGTWNSATDSKVNALAELLKTKEKSSKVLLFTQFADTAMYLAEQLKARGVDHVECVTAGSGNPFDVVRRFSPTSNKYEMKPGDEPVRVLVATEVLSEGQNCQDASVVINYDLPWAIIRLIQRAGRVDRIGQENAEIRIYSCLPNEGVERLIKLRERLLQRLHTNREVIGTDEKFFEEEEQEAIRNLYAEDPSVLEGQDDSDVDIPSRAQAIWQKAIEADPELEKIVSNLPNQVFATRHHDPSAESPNGVLIYFRTADGFDSLGRIAEDGRIVTQSLTAVLRAAECPPDVEPLPRHRKHHGLVAKLVTEAVKEQFVEGGALGDRRSIRRRVHERLSGYRSDLRARTDMFSAATTEDLDKVLNDIFRYSMTEHARNTFSRKFREGANDALLAELAITLREHGALIVQTEIGQSKEPELICSIGLFPKSEVVKPS